MTISNPTDKQKLKNIIVEITNCMARIDGEKDAIKEMVEDASEKFDLEKKIIRKIAKTMYKADYDSVVAENEHFYEMYETIAGKKKESEAA
jgi:cyanate lyase